MIVIIPNKEVAPRGIAQRFTIHEITDPIGSFRYSGSWAQPLLEKCAKCLPISLQNPIRDWGLGGVYLGKME